MLSEGRYALLLRPQVVGNLSGELQAEAQIELDREMSLVPAGEVLLEPISLGVPDEAAEPDDSQTEPGTVIQVATAYLDRYPVTNAQYQTFLDAGGYEQPAIWDPAVWPAVLGFVDATNQPGPRHWRHGRFPPGKDQHPVVGVCWYEAVAYARWVGKRLPADAEWVKAACWPVQLTTASRVQRKYPWGNSLERGRANLWSSGLGDTVAVDQLAAGGSVGGVFHLIGNVWEWMAEDFELPDEGQLERADRPLRKILRGGAFDTYFEQQATSQFASGESPLARRPNIGFRCALGICDLVDRSTRVPESDDDLASDEAELVASET
jgi:iron(II)-dependent oxidoreductase